MPWGCWGCHQWSNGKATGESSNLLISLVKTWIWPQMLVILAEMDGSASDCRNCKLCWVGLVILPVFLWRWKCSFHILVICDTSLYLRQEGGLLDMYGQKTGIAFPMISRRSLKSSCFVPTNAVMHCFTLDCSMLKSFPARWKGVPPVRGSSPLQYQGRPIQVATILVGHDQSPIVQYQTTWVILQGAHKNPRIVPSWAPKTGEVLQTNVGLVLIVEKEE